MAHFENNAPQQTEIQVPYWMLSALTSVAYTALHPMGHIQVIQQVQKVHPYLISQRLTSMLNFSYTDWITKRDGASALWKGNISGVIVCQQFLLQNNITQTLRKKGIIPNRESKPSFKKFFNHFLTHFGINTLGNILFYPAYAVGYRLMFDLEPVPFYTGNIDCLVKTLKIEGLAGLYSGIEYRILKLLAECFLNSIAFCFFGIEDEDDVEKDWKYFLNTFLVTALCYPFEVMSAREVGGFDMIGESEDGILEPWTCGFLVEISPKLVHFVYFLATKFKGN